MAEWIGLGLTIGAFMVTVSVLWGKFSARMDSIETLQDKQNKYHADHFDRIVKLETSAAANGQRQADHEKLDDTRFGQLAETMKEVKEELVRGRESVHDLRDDLHKWMAGR